MEQSIYCISGLGADERIFDRLGIAGWTLKFIPWLRPEADESIRAYAARMAAYIEDEQPVLVGVSFGGMVGIEIAKQVPVKKLILVSSIRSFNELPRWMRLAGKLRLNKILPVRSYRITERLDNRRLGASSEEEKLMAREYRQKAERVYLGWAVHQILNWKNDWQPEQLVHIHGDMDRIFPIRKLKPTHVIKSGTHMIVYNRANEVAECISRELAAPV